MQYRLAPILFMLLLAACTSPEDSYDSEPEPVIEEDGPFLDGEDVPGHVPYGYQFNYTVNCDTLDKETLEQMTTNGETFDLSITVTDSIVVSYGDPSDAYNFYDGYYALEDDTIKLWYTTGSWEDLDSYCVYRLKYTVPKPDLDKVVIKVGDYVEEVDLH